MSKTQIADVVIPSNFESYVFERTAETNAFFQSGIITDQTENLSFADGGQTIDMPFWQDLGSDEEDLSDSGSLTPAKITSGQQTARIMFLGKAWSVNDLAKWVAGDDPVQNLANLVGDFWGRVLNYRLMATLGGLFRTSTMDVNRLKINTESTDNTLDGSTFADGLNKLGDRKSLLTIIAMHSGVHTTLAKGGLISTERDKDNDYDFDTFGGRRVVMDDSLPMNGVHTIGVDMSADQATNQFRDAANGFITAGFEVGDTIVTTNFTDSALNATWTIAVITAGAITVEETGIIVDEAANAANMDSVLSYTSYLFGAGSIGFGRGNVGAAAFETDRDILAGDLTAASRATVVLHPGGCRFTSSSVAGAGATRAELELAVNWARVFEAKNVPIVQIRHR